MGQCAPLSTQQNHGWGSSWVKYRKLCRNFYWVTGDAEMIVDAFFVLRRVSKHLFFFDSEKYQAYRKSFEGTWVKESFGSPVCKNDPIV